MESLGELLRSQHEAVLDAQTLVRESNATVFNEVQAIGGALIKQNALLYVSEYKGKGEVTSWLDELEKCRVFNDLHDDVMGRLAWQRSSGTDAAFIRRQLDETLAPSWEVLRKSLEKEFGRVVDSLQSFTILPRFAKGDMRMWRHTLSGYLPSVKTLMVISGNKMILLKFRPSQSIWRG